MLGFILFYGLDWVATVPPTMALCRERFGADGPIVFGWVFAAHQIGAAAAAFGAGVVHDELGSYDVAWYVAGALCVVAASFCVAIRGRGRRRPRPDGSLHRAAGTLSIGTAGQGASVHHDRRARAPRGREQAVRVELVGAGRLDRRQRGRPREVVIRRGTGAPW